VVDLVIFGVADGRTQVHPTMLITATVIRQVGILVIIATARRPAADPAWVVAAATVVARMTTSALVLVLLRGLHMAGAALVEAPAEAVDHTMTGGTKLHEMRETLEEAEMEEAEVAVAASQTAPQTAEADMRLRWTVVAVHSRLTAARMEAAAGATTTYRPTTARHRHHQEHTGVVRPKISAATG